MSATKRRISNLFLYRYRFVTGYMLLFLAFVGLVFTLPLISPRGLTKEEMASVVNAYEISPQRIWAGDVIDLPYYALQRLVTTVFGLNFYTIKLPSMIISLFWGLAMILLLNRWFKSNVALCTSVIAVLSAPFLFLSGYGTPLIMLAFWPTLLLWLGSKIHKNAKPHFLLTASFILISLVALLTPFMIYFLLATLLFTLLNPHLRFVVKNLPKILLVPLVALVIAALGFFIYHVVFHFERVLPLLAFKDFSLVQFEANIDRAFLPFFTWNSTVSGIILSPLIGLATVSLAIIGFISTSRKLFASRSGIAFALFIFVIFLSGLNSQASLLLILPTAILVACGINYIFTKWYELFPENPYARIFALLPISFFLGLIIFSSLSHFVFGYRYTPSVATHFSNDLTLINSNLKSGDTLLVPAGTLEYDFYRILGQKTGIVISSNMPETMEGTVATLGHWSEKISSNADLKRIITSSKTLESDRIYLYIAN